MLAESPVLVVMLVVDTDEVASSAGILSCLFVSVHGFLVCISEVVLGDGVE